MVFLTALLQLTDSYFVRQQPWSGCSCREESAANLRWSTFTKSPFMLDTVGMTSDIFFTFSHKVRNCQTIFLLWWSDTLWVHSSSSSIYLLLFQNASTCTWLVDACVWENTQINLNVTSTVSKINRNFDTGYWKISHKRVYTSLVPSTFRQIRRTIQRSGSSYTCLVTDVCTKEGKNKQTKKKTFMWTYYKSISKY